MANDKKPRQGKWIRNLSIIFVLIVIVVGVAFFMLSTMANMGSVPPLDVEQSTNVEEEPINTITASPSPLPSQTPLASVTRDASASQTDSTPTIVAAVPTQVDVRPTQAAPTASDSTAEDEPTATLSSADASETYIAQVMQSTQAVIQQTITAVPVEAASVANTVGNANIYPFYDNEIQYPDTTIVELSLIFTSLNITATPFSAVTSVPITPLVPLPDVMAGGSSTMTPRPAQAQFAIEQVPPRVVAVLVCLDKSFTGCTTQPARNLEIGIDNRWYWILAPNADIRGRQNLRFEIYRADAEGHAVGNALWQSAFTITVKQEANPITTIIFIGGTALLIVVIVFAGYVLSMRRTALPAKKRKPKPKVFISYRRAVGYADARAVHDNLTLKGVDAFIDVEDIHAGAFSEHIQQNIRESDCFVLILAPHTLESEWVCKEVLYAFEHDKLIVPLLVNGFDLYGGEIPDELKDLQKQNALTVNAENFTFIMSRLLEWLGIDG